MSAPPASLALNTPGHEGTCPKMLLYTLDELQKATDVVAGGRLMGCGELWKVPTEPHFVEVAQVLLAHLVRFKDFMALHVVQRCAQQIGTLGFFARLCMLAGHLVPFIPLFEALADLFSLHMLKSASMWQAKLQQFILCSSLESLLSSLVRVVLESVSTVFLLGWAFFISTLDSEELLPQPCGRILQLSRH